MSETIYAAVLLIVGVLAIKQLNDNGDLTALKGWWMRLDERMRDNA